MCAAIAGLVRPVKVRLTTICVSSPLSDTVPVPLPPLETDGTCCQPASVAVYFWTGAAPIWPRISPPLKLPVWMLK